MPNPSNKNTLESVRANFSNYITIIDRGYETPCWEWHNSDPTTGGYGWVWISGKKWKAHRLAWTFFKGAIPKGLCVCHHCDNPPCANESHLFIGTKADNGRDMEEKGRAVHIKGETHPLAKLTEADVRFIRKNYQRGHHGLNTRTLARMFKVQKSLVWRIVKGISWPHVGNL